MREDRFCEGCRVAFKGDDAGPIHETDYCRSLWERRRLLAVVSAARDVAGSFDEEPVGLKPIERALVDALEAWDATQRHSGEGSSDPSG